MNILEKLKEKFIKNKKYILGIITGILISGTTVYAATIISAVNVSYSNTSSKLSSTNVQDAIDELYDKAKNYCPPGYKCKIEDLFSYTGDDGYGACIRKSNNQECFLAGNYKKEVSHAKEVFGENKCKYVEVSEDDSNGNYVQCFFNDYNYIKIYENNNVGYEVIENNCSLVELFSKDGLVSSGSGCREES